MNLDDVEQIRDLDPDHMLDRVAELPQQCQAAWDLAKAVDVPTACGQAQHVVVLGMGGSAIGGALLQGLVAHTRSRPISVVRGYQLPAFVQGDDYLVVGCSYSGNTEETLTAFGEAKSRGARTLAITTGGRLAEIAADVVEFAYASQPRAALGYSFTLLLGVLAQIGLLEGDFDAGMQEAIQVMRNLQQEIAAEVPVADNPAKQLAQRLHGRLPVIYGAGFLVPVANRWKTQVNENAKHWAFFEALPELHHNAVVGFGMPDAVREKVLVVMLRSVLDHARVQTRWQVTKELLEREQVAWQTLWGRGESHLAQMLSLIHLGDYASFYLAMLNQVDPTPVESIAFLKQRLAAAG